MQIYGYKPIDLPVDSYIAFMPNTTKFSSQKEINQMKNLWQKFNETSLNEFDVGQLSNTLCSPILESQSGVNSIIGHSKIIEILILTQFVAIFNYCKLQTFLNKCL